MRPPSNKGWRSVVRSRFLRSGAAGADRRQERRVAPRQIAHALFETGRPVELLAPAGGPEAAAPPGMLRRRALVRVFVREPGQVSRARAAVEAAGQTILEASGRSLGDPARVSVGTIALRQVP